jgi:ergothioneine biosynthesis protein EgtB
MQDYQSVRDQSVKICSSLEIEDYIVQPHDFVSPPKWHLGHTTWYFETFCLREFFKSEPFNPHYHFLFNSYYESQGEHVPQGRRGVCSRPTVSEVLAYRRHIDGRMREAESMIATRDPESRETWRNVVEVGIHHEQQHQELLYMDIKHILSHQREQPALAGAPNDSATETAARTWREFRAGVFETGWSEPGFAYDSERPRHRVFLEDFRIREGLVSNAEFHEFIEDGGYQRPELWLADGWAWVKASAIRAPLYWTAPGKQYSLQGEREIDPGSAVAHVSCFEADAFARWKKCRLPTEAEWEAAFGEEPCAQLWQWTNSAYLPYPGYKPFPGALMEYNGKFMSGQMVLRGGCLATPEGHYRSTYRNFFYPHMRWMFSGVRLCDS